MELRDVYHGGAGQSRQDNLLCDTLQLFQDLNTLQICLVRPRALQVLFSQAHLPALRHFMVSGCHHLFTEKDWALVGVVLPKTEHHHSDVLALGFQKFLRRHRKSLSSVTLTRPSRSAKDCHYSQLCFRGETLDSIWSSETVCCIACKAWERGGWDFCSLILGGPCIESDEERGTTMQELEEWELWEEGRGSD